MDKHLTLIKEVSAVVEDITSNAEGLDATVLLEAIHCTEFSEPLDGDSLLEELRSEGLL